MQFFRGRNSCLVLFYWAFDHRSRRAVCFCKALSFLYAAFFRFHRWRGSLGLHLFKMRLKVCLLLFQLSVWASLALMRVKFAFWLAVVVADALWALFQFEHARIECCKLLVHIAGRLPDRWFIFHDDDHNL